MSKDFKQVAIQYHLAYMNAKQRLDLSSRSLSVNLNQLQTIDYKIQLELYYQNGMKSIMDKYEDHKYDEAFQYVVTNSSNKFQVQEQIIADLKHAREDFSTLISKYTSELNIIHDKKEKSLAKLKSASQKQSQSFTFYSSIAKVFERNVLTIDLVNANVDQRLGHMKLIQDLAKNKENTYGNYKIAIDKYNQTYAEVLPELEQCYAQIKELESNIGECLRQFFQRISLAEVSALRNRQYDLDQVTKFLDKIDYSKIYTVFKFVDEVYTPIKAEPIVTYMTTAVNQFVQKYNLLNTDSKASPLPIIEQTLPQDLEQQILDLADSLINKKNDSDALIEKVEKQINSKTSTPTLLLLSQHIKAPCNISKPLLQQMAALLNKILDHVTKEGEFLHKLQKISTYLHYQQGETVSAFSIVSQNPLFSKKTDYWEWLIFWQINQTCEGVAESDKFLIIQQQFQNTIQQMAQLKLPVAIIHTFINDLAPYYGIKNQQIEEIKKLLSRFLLAQQSNPNSKLQMQSFDVME